MKIVCDACDAKYSIADEKVQGKVFKIRCKKCSHVIVVRGDTRVFDYDSADAAAPADDAVWHVVIDQQQVGPLTVADLQARLAAGELDADTFAWREGFAEWQPLAEVSELAALVQSAAAGPAISDAAATGGLAHVAGGGSAHAAAGAAHAAAGAAHAPTAGAAHAAAGAAHATAAGSPNLDAPSAAATAGPALKGQRNESSVLFSLGNLSAIAADAPRAVASGSGASAGAAGHGGSEGSGLIDIRSMASAYLGPRTAARGPAGPKVGSADDLPVFSTAAFNEPAVIIPMGGARNNNRVLYALLAAVALLAIIAVVLVVVVMGKKTPATPSVANASPRPEPTTTPSTTTPSATTPSATTPSATAPSMTAPSATAPSTTAASPTATAPSSAPNSTSPTGSPSGSPSSTPSSTPGKTTRTSTTTTRASSTTTRTPSPPVKTETVGKCSLDETGCLLASRPPPCCEVYSGRQRSTTTTTTTTATKPPVATGDLPESLTKPTISAGLATVQTKAKACGARSSAKGRVMIAYKIAASGAVTSASVKESPDPALGACVAAAAKTGKFPPTQTGGSFQYPYNF